MCNCSEDKNFDGEACPQDCPADCVVDCNGRTCERKGCPVNRSPIPCNCEDDGK